MCCDLLIRMVFHFIFGHWNTKRKVQCHFHQISTNVFSGVHSAVESFMANKFNLPVLALMLWPTEQDYTSECLRLSTSVAHQSFKIWMSSSGFCAKIICDSSNCVAFLKDIDTTLTHWLTQTYQMNIYEWRSSVCRQWELCPEMHSLLIGIKMGRGYSWIWQERGNLSSGAAVQQGKMTC